MNIDAEIELAEAIERNEELSYNIWKEEQEEIEWLQSQGSSWLHQQFHSALDRLEIFINEDEYELTMMSVAYAVTQFEVFIQNSLIKLTNENEQLMYNAQTNISELSDRKVKFKSLKPNTIKEEVNSYLLDNLYHNIPKTKEIIEAVLDKSIDINITNACKVTKIRHDIVHRGGADKKGSPMEINKDIALECLNHIRILGDAFHTEFINT